MARIPIEILKLDTSAYKNYLVKITDKNTHWDRTFSCRERDLRQLQKEINDILGPLSTAELLSITEKQASQVEEAHIKDSLCSGCKYKMTKECKICLFDLQSPLERMLFLNLLKEEIAFTPQYGLNWQGESISVVGKTYDNPNNNFKEVLTIVDFFIEKNDKKLCVYTDGHSYHERTEKQAQKDRKIDRKLQELGFQVLRYTGKDVKENMIDVIFDIKKRIS